MTLPICARLLFCALVLCPVTVAQDPEPLTPEWIRSKACRAVTTLPDVHWLADGTLLVRDLRKNAPGFEVFEPSTGRRWDILDKRKALLRLSGHLQTPLERLPRPAAYDRTGDRVLYSLDGDLFVLDMASARVTRVTDTPEMEHSIQFSPDGSRISFVRAGDLYVHDIDTRKTWRLTRDGSETILNGTLSWVYWEEIFGRRDIGYWWSGDSRSIAFLRTDQSLVGVVTHVDFLPETPRVIKQRYPKVGTANPVVRVGVVQVGDDQGPVWLRLGNDGYEYLCRVKWMPGDTRLAVQTMDRSQKKLELWFAERKDGSSRRILTETDPAWVNIHDDLYFLADGRHFLWVSERSGHAHLYRYTLDGKLVNQVTKGDWSLRAANPVFWLRKAVQGIDEKAGVVYFSALAKTSLEKQLYRVRLDGTGLQRLTDGNGTYGILFSRDASHFVARFSSSDTPPSLSVHKADGSRIKELAPPRKDLVAPLDLSYPEFIHIPAADGFKMPAMIFKPRDFDPSKRYPVILHTYGGPSAPQVSNAWLGWVWLNTILTRKGYVVATVDNRSATAVSKKLENTILGQMGGDRELEDLVAAARWIKGRPWADPARIGTWGWSNGGMMTLLLMTRSKEFKAGIAVAPVTNWLYYDTKWCETVNKLPEDNPEGYEKTNLVKRAKDLHGRLLLVHGSYDDNVHIQNTWHFVDELVAAGKMFELMVYPMRKHGISDDPAYSHLLKTMISFWDRNL